MRTIPLAAIIAVPLIAALVIFVLLPRLQQAEEERAKKRPKRFSLRRFRLQSR